MLPDTIFALLKIFDDFTLCSALKVNSDKTKTKYNISLKHRIDSPLVLEWTNDSVSLL